MFRFIQTNPYKFLLPILALTSLFTSACGNITEQIYQDRKIKNYHLYIESNDDTVQASFKEMIEEFNGRVGFVVLHYEKEKINANSIVSLVPGLKEKKGSSVGLGRYIMETQMQSLLVTNAIDKPVRELIYSMRIHIDEKYYFDRMAFKTAEQKTQLFTLICHEVGHGLEKGHVDDKSDVMYPNNISQGSKDFDRYFAYVREYMFDLN